MSRFLIDDRVKILGLPSFYGIINKTLVHQDDDDPYTEYFVALFDATDGFVEELWVDEDLIELLGE